MLECKANLDQLEMCNSILVKVFEEVYLLVFIFNLALVYVDQFCIWNQFFKINIFNNYK
jgi:hypothetical protein